MISIKINGKNIELDDWKKADPPHTLGNLVRKSNNMLGDKIYLSQIYYNSVGYCWFTIFRGPNLSCLQNIYYQLYPIETNYFLVHQLEEAKSHVDRFLDQIPSLLSFI